MSRLIDRDLLKNKTASKYWKSLKKERGVFRMQTLANVLQFMQKIRRKKSAASKIAVKVPKNVVSLASKPLNLLLNLLIKGRAEMRAVASSSYSALLFSSAVNEKEQLDVVDRDIGLLTVVAKVIIMYQMALSIYSSVMNMCTPDLCPHMVSLASFLPLCLLQSVSIFVSLF